MEGDESEPPKDVGLPTGNLRLADLARLAYVVADRRVSAAEARGAAEGKTIACGKGCAACCRQVIPVSPAEAFAFRELFASFPAPRRRALASRLRRRQGDLSVAQAEGRLDPWDPDSHFSAYLACPFLEDEACSVHPQRPVACREHLVVSAAAHCGSFPSSSIRPLVLTEPVAEALGLACADLLDTAPMRIPLHAALAWAEENAEAGRRTWPRERALSALSRRLGGEVFSR